MAHQKAFTCALIVLLSGVQLAAVSAPASGQTASVARGATVRVSRADSAGHPLWSTGRVVYLASDRLLLAETDGDPLVRLNEALRLQVRRTHSKSVYGGVLGFGAGALAGWPVGREVGGQTGATAASITGALLGGIAGAGLGAFLGSRIRSIRWEDVTLVGGRLSPAALDEGRSALDYRRVGTYRWTRFDPTVADFQAFFERLAASLDPVEGIWALSGALTAVAIVRDGGPAERKFAAFEVVMPEGRPVHRGDGTMLFALEQGADGDRWYVRFPGSTPLRFVATLDEGVLALEYGGGRWEYWEKLFPD